MTRREAIANAAVLTGIGISIPSLSIVLSSCKSEPIAQLDVLSETQAASLKALGELILPKGQSLGAADVPLTKLTDILLRDCETEEGKTETLRTLDYFAANGISEEGFDEVLKSVEKQVFSEEPTQDDYKGYRRLKSYILFAFFTSENVMETMLDYNAVPTKFEVCQPVTDETRVYVDLNV